MPNLFRPDLGKVDRLIAGFPEPLCLRASAIKWWAIIAIGPALVALFGSMAIFDYLKHGSAAAGGGAFLIFLGIVVGSPVVVLGRRGLRGSLQLDQDGFQVSGQKQYLWREVIDFGTRAYKGNRSVTFAAPNELKPYLLGGPGGAYWPGMPSPIQSAPEVDPFVVFLIPDTYGFSAYDLARLMNGWRELAAPAKAPDFPKPSRLRDAPRSMEKSRSR